ncbi:hypothetical protein [Mesorhizobium silamurunense]|uniref:hypothetical protein n=1 Tax=Mesorhizobium silamurunense TaxID=499528 RepID=UPI0017832DA2|nr:hypothetical protein [Mesorhizobium silamurunense]
MSDGFYLDNDVVLKTCSYGAGAELVELSTTGNLAPAILALARFTLRSRVERSRVLVDAQNASAQLDAILAQLRFLEPTPEEVEIAADFEAAATKANLSFDAGESQLVAMLMARGGVALVSGDKRAAKAMSVVVPELERRLVCLEQVLHSIIARFGLEPLRSSVCREKSSDRAVTNCFQCSSQQVEAPSVLQALESYLRSLRSETGRLLVKSAGMSSAEVA